ncbi:hypothetical protein OZK63_39110 [Streptomyces sp. UMAF16]|nr:hypothetical protein [Streptomyces sp. UMAF16]
MIEVDSDPAERFSSGITEAELRGVQKLLDLEPHLVDGLRAYFLLNISLTESGKIAGMSRQAMRYKVNYVKTHCEKIRAVISAIGADRAGRDFLNSLSFPG